MKLLSKNEINQKKTSERKLEIDEGIKLAKKVDSLRETFTEEQRNLEKFRSGTTKAVYEEIDCLISKKTDLVSEIEVLKENREKLLIPLDEEWSKINEREKEIALLESKVILKKELLDKNLKESDLKLTEIKYSENRIDFLESEAEEKSIRAVQALKEAQKSLQDAEVVKKNIYIHSEKTLAQLMERELAVAIRERETEIKSEQIIKDRKALDDRERFINDKYTTLLRAQKYGERK